MVPERIEREILIHASPERVWAVVTEPQHLAGWFSDAATIDLRPGGEATLAWDDHGSYRARVVEVRPPRAFSFRWVRCEGVDPTEGNSTLVAFTLTPEGDGTRLRVVETGFSELDWPEEDTSRYAGENARGWELELGELAAYASRLFGPPAPA